MPMKPVSLRTTDEGKRATWLELFYDLIFVIVIARLTHLITVGHHGHVGAVEYLTYAALFVPVWWAWTGHTLFQNRFGNNDVLDRLLTLQLMFFLILLAVFVTDAFGKSAVPFALTFGAIRMTLVFMYLRVYVSNPDMRAVTGGFIRGFGTGASLWLVSVLFPAPYIYGIWVLAMIVDMLTPVLMHKNLNVVSVHREHLPERTGLLAIILLGESILGLVAGMEDIEWTAIFVLDLFLAFTFVCCIWWLYFETLERRIMGKLQGAAQLHIYSHLPIYIGMGMLAAAMQHLVALDYTDQHLGFLFSASLLLILIPLQVVHYHHMEGEHRRLFVGRGIFVGAFIAMLGLISPYLISQVQAALLVVVLILYIYTEHVYMCREEEEADIQESLGSSS